MDETKIKKEAKKMLNRFADALKVIDNKDFDEGVVREVSEREEGNGNDCKEGFKNKLLKNALDSDEDFIIAERGKWT
jgi:hypothetical protein